MVRPMSSSRLINMVMVCAGLVAGSGCGGQPAPTLTSRQALTGTAELLEFEPSLTRRELFRDLLRTATTQTGNDTASKGLLFPMYRDGVFVGAPAPDSRNDLLGSTDAGVATLQILFDTRGEHFAEDRRDAFQGLSEREAAELIARSLLSRWNVAAPSVTVVRAPGAPYAAAYIDGVLRINPAFVYMAAAPVAP